MYCSLSACWCRVYFKWEYISTYFHQLRREDGLFEWLTAIFFAAASVYIFRSIHSMLKKPVRDKLLFAFLCVFAVGAFLVAGEEISWGQRIFGLETPQFIAENNTQGEITIHNNKTVLKYVYVAYWIVAGYAATSWLLAAILRKQKSLSKLVKNYRYLIPPWYLLPYFLPTLYYTSYRFLIGWTYLGIGQWEETTELFFALGILLYAVYVFELVTAVKK